MAEPDGQPLPIQGQARDSLALQGGRDGAIGGLQHDAQDNLETGKSVGEDSNGEADTCRICRGEAVEGEPLFYPCKCSGSIKFVHQDCLMEWLSHSQKKHCELCKTPFRFTKLYAPNMPQTLPTHVFLRHFLLHIFRNFGTWLKFCLVTVVWLGCVPYATRQIWRVLFWFSDGGWPSRYSTSAFSSNATTTTMKVLDMTQSHIESLASGTSPVSPLQAAQTTSATAASLLSTLIEMLPWSHLRNGTISDKMADRLLETIHETITSPDARGFEGSLNATLSQISAKLTSLHRQSLLSEVTFFKHLTVYPSLNQLFISITEGYIITVLVVVSFILVFLIREWVVQQQPGLNMGAGFNAEFLANQQRNLPAGPVAAEVQNQEQPEAGPRPIARLRRRNIPPGNVDAREIDALGHANAPSETDSTTRPVMPPRNTLPPPAEIQMTEEFLSIWRRAGSDPQEVLRIIEREGLGDRMQYWVNAMQSLPLSDSTPDEATLSRRPLPRSVTDTLKRDRSSSGSDDSWVDVDGTDLNNTDRAALERRRQKDTAAAASKGKHKANSDSPFSLGPPDVSTSSTIRPRARSDGPQPKGRSLLSDNNWSFANLTADTSESQSDTARASDATLPEHLSSSNHLSHHSVPSPPLGSEAWKAAQELRVQQAMIRGIRARQAATHNHAAVGVMNDAEATPTSDSISANGPLEIRGLDGVVRVHKSWDEVFDANPMQSGTVSRPLASSEGSMPVIGRNRSGLDDHQPTASDPPYNEDGDSKRIVHFEPPPLELNIPDHPESSDWRTVSDNPSNSDAAEVEDGTPAVDLPGNPHPAPAEPQGLLARIADWLWVVVDHAIDEEMDQNDEHIVEDLAVEAPFVPVGGAHDNHADPEPANVPQDPEVLQAAIAAGLDPNDPAAIEDIEDFDGIMELIGMRGPLFGLVQNALFSTFLLAVTVSFGVWLPYNIGRITLLLLANPVPAIVEPLRLLFSLAAFLQDLAIAVLGILSWTLVTAVSIPLHLWSFFKGPPSWISPSGMSFATNSLKLSGVALGRIANGTVEGLVKISDSEIFIFSAASHEALLEFKSDLANIGDTIVSVALGQFNWQLSTKWHQLLAFLQLAHHTVVGLPALLTRPDAWVISLEVTKRVTPLDLDLSVWGATDRAWATLAGYGTLCVLGAIYVQKGAAFSQGQAGRELEATLLDLLNQAGGVLKVILIISIEMLVFPLYCGMLLDAALLPLFENATVMSRILFTLKSPLTSIFVHWFVGTCYMFHFALFVSMCRKIMRKGVLCKLCPSSSRLSLTNADFIRDPDDPNFHPVRDVLERNVVTQLRKILFSAVVYGALVMVCLGGVVWGLAYAFQGVLPIHWSSNEPVLEFPIDLLFYNFLMPLAVKFFKPSDGLHSMYSWWFHRCARLLRLTWFLFDERQLDEEGENVRRSWRDVLRRVQGDPFDMIQSDDVAATFREHPELDAFYRPNGRYVRAPASDSVRLQRGGQIFIPVDESNNRLEGEPEVLDAVDGRDSDLWKQVYIPPLFRFRISLFIVSIWVFAALTGVCITIVPLVFGRYVFGHIIPSHVRKNDVYAFSIGIYILGSALYLTLHLRHILTTISNYLSFTPETPRNAFRRIKTSTILGSRILWTYTAFLILLPTLFAFVIEFYLILPLHTYYSLTEPHIVHFVQSWTLGLLYVKLTTRLILWHQDSRPAEALRSIFRDGYFNPDARLATRSFILPVGVCLSVALAVPWGLASIAVKVSGLDIDPTSTMLVYRYSYPAVLTAVCWGFALSLMVEVVKGWKQKIKDEAYLIGERLHNFGEGARRSSGVGGLPGSRRIDT